MQVELLEILEDVDFRYELNYYFNHYLTSNNAQCETTCQGKVIFFICETVGSGYYISKYLQYTVLTTLDGVLVSIA